MSWHWLVTLVFCVPGPCAPPAHSPAIDPLDASAKMRGRLTIRAFCRRSDRNLNDVDAEEGGVRILFRIQTGASRQLLRRSHRARPGAVDVEIVRILRVPDQRVRMRAAAGLHRRHLHRLLHVLDVEHAHAAEALGADRRLDALRAAIEPPARLFDRHHEQRALHRHVALATRADDRRHELRLRRVRDVVDVEPVEIADEQMVAAEREIGIREAQAGDDAGDLRFLGGRGLGVRIRGFGALGNLGPGGQTRRILRIEESRRLRHVGDEFEIANRDAGVAQTGLQADARIGVGRGRFERHRRMPLPAVPLMLRGADQRGAEHGERDATQSCRCESHWCSSFTVTSIALMRSISIR